MNSSGAEPGCNPFLPSARERRGVSDGLSGHWTPVGPFPLMPPSGWPPVTAASGQAAASTASIFGGALDCRRSNLLGAA